MRQIIKRILHAKLKKKHEATSSVYIYIPMIFLCILCLFYINTYTKATEVLADNFKTSLDAANLSTTTINMDQILNGRTTEVSITGHSVEGALTTAEIIAVQKHFVTYENALKDNVGLTDSFSFSGGTCGWAANFLAKDTLKINNFRIYEIVKNEVYEYTIKNVSAYTTDPDVSKTKVGTVVKNSLGKVTSTTAQTPDGEEIYYPTVYSQISFTALAPLGALTEYFLEDTNKLNADTADFVQNGKVVSSSSTTAVKENVDNSTTENETFSIVFDGNKGSGNTYPSISNQFIKVRYHDSYGTLPTASRTGYTFLGWYTSPVGGTKVTSATKLTSKSNKVVYAQWKIKMNVTDWIGLADGGEHSITATCDDSAVTIMYSEDNVNWSSIPFTYSQCETNKTIYCKGLIDNAESYTTTGKVIINHNYNQMIVSNDYVSSVPTCTDDGLYFYACKICGKPSNDINKTYTVEAYGHDFSDDIDGSLRTESTPYQKATYYDKCTRCGKDALTWHYAK